MRPLLVRGCAGLKGKITLPGDKSIAHRALIISALSKGKTVISNFPANQDCLTTLNALKKLGLKIKRNDSRAVTIRGNGLGGLSRPEGHVLVGESGTTLRLLLGVLAAQNFSTRLIAAKSLSRRPMLRVNTPLRMMGAKISAKRKAQNAKIEEYPPITIKGAKLKPITCKMSVPSAQVKSAILLAGLYACGRTRIIEPIKTRDHTERMLKVFKAGIKVKGNNIFIKGGRELTTPGRIRLAGDISSASFFICGATILPDSKVLIKNISFNPSRTGLIRVLKRMGADIKVQRVRTNAGEPSADILVRSSRLKGISVKNKEIPSLIDELPVLMVTACFAKGKTVFEGVRELRVKETDRIRSMSDNLTRMGADIRVVRQGKSENIVIEGGKRLKGARVKTFSDHRTAMSMIIAGLSASGATSIDNLGCINKSFPEFLTLLRPLLH